MITLITGVPGAGKTAYAVAYLQEVLAAADRPVFVLGIHDLKLPHSELPPVSEWTREVKVAGSEELVEVQFSLPDKAIVVIDEAQKVFRPRGTGAKVPPYIQAFETHRHLGLDFILITQAPTLIDSAVRHLVGKHIHLRAHWAGRQLLEWSECSDPESRTDRAVATSRPYKLPAHVFANYRSATVHVKPERRLPVALAVFVVVCGVGGWLGWKSYNRISGAIAPGSVSASAPAGVEQAPRTSSAAVVASQAPVGITIAEYVPRISTRPETAPLYDSIRQVKSMPTVAGCVASRTRCVCITAQGTDAFLTEGECREWLRVPHFDPWREPSSAKQSPSLTGRDDRGGVNGGASVSGPVSPQAIPLHKGAKSNG